MGIRIMIMVAALAAPGLSAGDGAQADSLWQSVALMFRSGGSLMWVMLGASVIGLTFVMERLFALRMGAHLKVELCTHLDWLLAHEGVEAARDYARKDGSTLGRTHGAAIERMESPRRDVERALEEELARALWDERRTVRPVGIVATVAPLLGLLGTVIGMIDAFRNAAENGMDNPALFAGGIYQALYTTAFGLMISIPFLVLYHYLRGRVEQVMRRVEDQALAFVGELELAQHECGQDEGECGREVA